MDCNRHQEYLEVTSEFINKEVEEIDKLISPSQWCIRLPKEDVLAAFDSETKKLSLECHDDFHIQQNISYGNTERQQFDILSRTKDHTNGPLFVFFHGGYWMAMRRDQFYHIGKALIRNGITFVTVGYDLAPEATMTEIVRQCSVALGDIINIAKTRNCRDIYIAGHSAGGHLAIMSACCLSALPEVAHLIKGFVLMSAVFDLHPIQLSTENKILQITDSEAIKYSPVSLECTEKLKRFLSHCKFLVIIPEYDAPEFWRQGKYFHQILLEHKLDSELFPLKGRDHFDYIEHLEDPNFYLNLKILNFINTSEST